MHALNACYYAAARYKKLHDSQLAELRRLWLGTRYLVIDEISFVSYTNLAHIHRRLVEITGVQQEFGGLSIIAVGDLYQLPPVKAEMVFQTPRGPLASGPHLWRTQFKLHELNTNQRQQGDNSWAQHLNALRSCTDAVAVDQAEAALRTRLRANMPAAEQQAAIWEELPRLLPTNAAVHDHNMAMLQRLAASNTPVYDVHAQHRRLHDNGKVDTREVLPAEIPKDADDCGGLAHIVTLAVGARVMLRRNLATEDGLVNGAQGVVVDFEWPAGPRAPGTAPTAVLVKFDNARVGAETRRLQVSVLILQIWSAGCEDDGRGATFGCLCVCKAQTHSGAIC